MRRKIILNISVSLASQAVGVLCGFILPHLILRYYGSDVNGLTQSLKQFLSVISFLEFGVGQVICSSLYRPLSNHDHHQISAVMDSGRRFYRRLALILSGYVLILLVFYPILMRNTFDWFDVAALIFAMSISSFAQYYCGIVNELLLHADQRSYVVYSLNIITNILNVLLSALLISAGTSIQTVKLTSSMVFLLRPALTSLYIRHHYLIDRKVQYSGEPISQKWNGMAQHISAVVLDGTDTIVLTLFSTLTNVSVYSVYYMVISSLQTLYQSATSGIQSAAGALWARQDHEKLNRTFDMMESILHFVTVFLFTCTAILIVPFVQVYTAGQNDAEYTQPVFAAILVLAFAIRCLRTPYNIWILAAGHYKQTQHCHIIAASLNLTISILSVYYMGLVGVAIGTLCAMIYQTGYIVLYNVHNLLKRPFKSILKQFLADALASAGIVLCTQWVPLNVASYFEWICAAIPVALIAAAVTVAIACLFYSRRIIDCFRAFSHF